MSTFGDLSLTLLMRYPLPVTTSFLIFLNTIALVYLGLKHSGLSDWSPVEVVRRIALGLGLDLE